MKKIISVITLLVVMFLVIFSVNIYAVKLETVVVTTDKERVKSGENVTVNIEFGEELGAYTFDVGYDNTFFEYVSAEGGEVDDNGTRVKVAFYDNAGGANPRSNMSVTFKAKEVTESNSTNFSVTATGLAKPNTDSYDDIEEAMVKYVNVDPDYKDYDIRLEHSGDIIKNEEKNMKLIVSSSMGRYYEHTRIIAETTTPAGGTVKLLGTDSDEQEHDIIQTGWGKDEGDPIGGKDAVKELDIRGLFSNSGKYTITLKLINLDEDSMVIASKEFNIDVKETKGDNVDTSKDDEQTGDKTDKDEGEEEKTATNKENKEEDEKEPSTMPKTGNTVYWYVVPALTILIASYVSLRRKE